MGRAITLTMQPLMLATVRNKIPCFIPTTAGTAGLGFEFHWVDAGFSKILNLQIKLYSVMSLTTLKLLRN